MKKVALIIASSIMLPGLAAQSPRVSASTDESLVRALDQLVQDLESARSEAIKVRTRLVEATSDEERKHLLRRVRDIRAKLRGLTETFESTAGSAATDADPLRNKIHAALSEQDLKKAASQLKAIEKREQNSKLLALIRFSYADVLRMQAEQHIRSDSSRAQAQNLLKRARKLYEGALEAPDLSDEKVGSSIHACALRHIVQIHAAFFDAHMALARTRKRGAKRDAANARAAAIKAADLIRRLHPQARLASGELVIQAVERDVRRLTGGR